MKLIHCDGCGFTEPENLPKHKIKKITALIIKDHRFPEGTDKYEADLCPNCVGMMLHNYFKTPAEGKLELPAFIGPKRDHASEIPETESLGIRSERARLG